MKRRFLLPRAAATTADNRDAFSLAEAKLDAKMRLLAAILLLVPITVRSQALDGLSASFHGDHGVVAPPIVDPGEVQREIVSCLDHGGRPIPCTEVGEKDRLRELNLPILTRPETPWLDNAGVSASDDRWDELKGWHAATLADYETGIAAVDREVNAGLRADPALKISTEDLALHNKQRAYEVATILEEQGRRRLHDTDNKLAMLEEKRESRRDNEARYRARKELLQDYKAAREAVRDNIAAWLEERRGIHDAAVAQAADDAAAYEAHLATAPTAPTPRAPPAAGKGAGAAGKEPRADRTYRRMLNNRDWAAYWSEERRFEIEKARFLRNFEKADVQALAEANHVRDIETELGEEELKISIAAILIAKAEKYEADMREKKDDKDAKIASVDATRAHLADVLVPERAASTDEHAARVDAHTFAPHENFGDFREAVHEAAEAAAAEAEAGGGDDAAAAGTPDAGEGGATTAGP